MADFHFVVQGKGGCGKSFVASLLFQYLKDKKVPVYGVDTDPVNNTFAGYKEFGVEVLPILKGNDIDHREFDKLVEIALAQPADGHLVVDNGASSFVPLCSYLLENEVINLLQGEGHTVKMHTVVTGGGGLLDTTNGLASLADHFPTTPLVVWLNSKDGEIKLKGKSFYDFNVYKEHADKFHAVIEIPLRSVATFGKDLTDHLARRESFDAAIHSSLPIMVRSRLTRFWGDCVEVMDRANLLDAE